MTGSPWGSNRGRMFIGLFILSRRVQVFSCEHNLQFALVIFSPYILYNLLIFHRTPL